MPHGAYATAVNGWAGGGSLKWRPLLPAPPGPADWGPSAAPPAPAGLTDGVAPLPPFPAPAAHRRGSAPPLPRTFSPECLTDDGWASAGVAARCRRRRARRSPGHSPAPPQAVEDPDHVGGAL